MKYSKAGGKTPICFLYLYVWTLKVTNLDTFIIFSIKKRNFLAGLRVYME
ncbi:hypothetical protein SAMN03159341_111104 [Paenibacillus sp. 1_12]|nr:hypothetical protein SAMN03159341_111104 [Paenibacillus sp. 1_12]